MLARYVHGLSPGDDPIVAYSGASTALSNARFLHADRLGSIVLSSRTQGALPAAYAYDEYGIHGSVTPPRFGYTGQVLLPEAGLYYYKARMYSPNLGRFMQPDPIGYGDGMNIYAYVGNNPVNRIDPSGLRTCTPIEIIEGEPLPENAIRVCGDRPRVSLSLRRGHGGCEPTDGLCIVMLFHPKPQYIGGEGNDGVSSSQQKEEDEEANLLGCLGSVGLGAGVGALNPAGTAINAGRGILDSVNRTGPNDARFLSPDEQAQSRNQGRMPPRSMTFRRGARIIGKKIVEGHPAVRAAGALIGGGAALLTNPKCGIGIGSEIPNPPIL